MAALVSIVSIFLLLICSSRGERNKLLVVSLDGFGHSIFTTHPNETQALSKLFVDGGLFASDGMIPTFSSQTLPVHFSMATGLHQETHGIVGNYFYDLEIGEKFACGVNSDDAKWFNDYAEPIWSVAEKQGVKTLVTNWFTSQVNFTANFSKPSFTRKFARHNLLTDLNEAIDMLTTYNAVDLAMVYHHEPDNTTHKMGTNSEETRQILLNINRTFTEIHERLVRENLLDKINIMIVSDHGAANVGQSIYLLDLVPDIVNCTRYIDDGGAILHIWTKDWECTAKVAEAIAKAAFKLHEEHGRHLMRAFTKREILKEWHYANHSRIGDILVEPIVGVHVVKSVDSYTEEWPRPKGDHGWDVFHPRMRSIFIAKGPVFKNQSVASRSVVEYYNLMTQIMGIKGNSNNGTKEGFGQVLNLKNNCSSLVLSTALMLLALLTTFITL